jgi:hypothetical protein
MSARQFAAAVVLLLFAVVYFLGSASKTFVASPVHTAPITLGCSGTATAKSYWEDGDRNWEWPLSDLSIVVDLDKKVVSGLWEHWDNGTPVYTALPIVAADANSVRFEASKEDFERKRISIMGTVDRITGVIGASEQELSLVYKEATYTDYHLQCTAMKPLF